MIIWKYLQCFANAFDLIDAVYPLYETLMTDCSTFEFINYPSLLKVILNQFYLKFKIGMTICYDCNHSLFSRMYSLSGGVDLIVNSTGEILCMINGSNTTRQEQ